MQVATTIQFRNTVRKYMAKKGLRCWGSYTNPSTKGHRTVGFMITGATPEMAAKIEKKLNKKGLTAQTRCTGEGYSDSLSGCFYGGAHTYIRGTCVFVK